MSSNKNPKGFVNPEELVGRHYTEFDLDRLKYQARLEIKYSLSRLSFHDLPGHDKEQERKRGLP